jgi:hypothetical protein
MKQAGAPDASCQCRQPCHRSIHIQQRQLYLCQGRLFSHLSQDPGILPCLPCSFHLLCAQGDVSNSTVPQHCARGQQGLEALLQSMQTARHWLYTRLRRS